MIERGQELKRRLKEYSDAYYNSGESLVTDSEYDALFEEYQEIERLHPELKTEDSPTLLVGSEPSEEGKKITHTTPLLSIENKGKTSAELKKWYDDIGGEGTEVIIQPKFDGITINLRYTPDESGSVLVNAAKRGNGFIGLDVTSAVKTVKSVLQHTEIEGELEVRGEGIFYYTPFMEKHSKEVGGEYSNPRNLAAGSFGLLDPEEVSKRELDVVFYDVGVCPVEFTTEEERLIWLSKNGFKITPYIVVNSFDTLEMICSTYFGGRIKEKGGFNILDVDGPVTDILCDGLVIKVNNIKERENLGMTSRGPRGFYAHKFESAKAVTKLEDITIQVGRTGKLTPVGHVDASIGGTSIKRVTLNNLDYMKNLGPAPFDYDKITVLINGVECDVLESDDFGMTAIIQMDNKNLNISSSEIALIAQGYFVYVNGIPNKVKKAVLWTDRKISMVEVVLEDKSFFVKPSKIFNAMTNEIKNSSVEQSVKVVEVGYFDLKIGDSILLERANDVIPRTLGIFYEMRDGSEKEIVWPTHCPTCGEEVKNLYPQHYCTNINCHDRLVGSLLHFVKRDAMDIDGFGEKIAIQFINDGFIKSLVDIYTLDAFEDDILKIRGFGKNKLENLYKSIENSKNKKFHQFIYSLGINECGRSTSKLLAKHFKNIDALMAAQVQDLLKLEDIGIVAANSIYSFFKKNRDLVEEFKRIGLCMTEEESTAGTSFSGKTFVITGTLLHPRSFYQEIIEKNGGKVSGSVSKKTNYVVIGTDAGSKEDKAKELVEKGAPITLLLGHDAFMEIV